MADIVFVASNTYAFFALCVLYREASIASSATSRRARPPTRRPRDRRQPHRARGLASCSALYLIARTAVPGEDLIDVRRRLAPGRRADRGAGRHRGTRSAGTWPRCTAMARRRPVTASSGPIERRDLSASARIDPKREQRWTVYTYSLIGFSIFSFLSVYGAASGCRVAPLQPHRRPGESCRTCRSTPRVSFMTNTNWQSYGGEATMSHLTQMDGALGAELRLGCRRHGDSRRADPRVFAAAGVRRSATSGSTWSVRPFASCCRSPSWWRRAA